MRVNRGSKQRRRFLQSWFGGSLLFPGVLSELMAAEDGTAVSGNRSAASAGHFIGRAKRVIVVFLQGGLSHLDSLDPKPRLRRDAGRVLPEGRLLAPLWKFRRRGESGLPVSDLFPHVGQCADELCVLRSLHTDSSDHTSATQGMHTGSVTVARPSMGSWISYGLGTFNRDLPAFVVISDATPRAGKPIWGPAFLPGHHQGVRVVPGRSPVANANRRDTRSVQRAQLGLLASLNRRHLAERDHDGQLAARIKSFETAFRMQDEAPAAFDFSRESAATLAAYGVQGSGRPGFGWHCLAARRLAERGVRFIELIHGTGSIAWDSHKDMAEHEKYALDADRPLAALLADLKQRGMLDDTLVVCTTEFGRTPWAENVQGRAHHPHVFSSWLAGGGVRGGTTYGASDEYGHRVAENPVHVHDFHATILHLLGLDHTRLTYRYAGRDFRLTDVEGNVIHEIMA